ncbi:uncharacterized protein LOC107632570 [Arachis ipaensis]|uniref:uncharacterized protein LOC107632570 n=1 Tax=Arachis ipaensis TaxID=130454 RepID=UPI0007AF28D3|nr:uncharacterized protein LOC107632570 [Arachis ipaensis]
MKTSRVKAGSRQWHEKLCSELSASGYIQSKHDYALFTRASNSTFTAILEYVDNLVLVGDCLNEINRIKKILDDAFKIKDIGKLKYLIGMKVARSSKGIALYQCNYVLELVSEYDMLNAKLVTMPMNYSTKLSKDYAALFQDVSFYRRLVGRLLYLTNTRPDISFAVRKLSQCLDCPTIAHHQAMLCVLKYLKLALLEVYSFQHHPTCVSLRTPTSDWAGWPDTCRLVTTTCFFLGN